MFHPGDEAVPGYRLQEPIGSGSFGEVWKVRGPGGTLAALKFINLRADHGPKELRAIERIKEIRCAHLVPVTAIWLLDQAGRVLEEAAAAHCLARQTVSLAGAFESDEAMPVALVVAMPLGDQSLADRLRQCRAAGLEGIPPAELLDYIDHVAQGIDYLNAPRHELGEGLAGVQHGDVKPRNIILMGGAAQLCDFGLARVLGESATATCMGGTPAYLAPECLRERRYSHATDQYSLAISYHELRTGRLPFEADSVSSILEIHKNSLLNFDRLPPAERAIVRRATSLDPAARYASCQEFARALRLAAEPFFGVGVSPARNVGVPPAHGADLAPVANIPAGRLHHNAAASCDTPVDAISSTPVESTLPLTGGSSVPGSAAPSPRAAGRRVKLAAGFILLALFGAGVPLSSMMRNRARPVQTAAVANVPDDDARHRGVPASSARFAAPVQHHAQRDNEGGADDDSHLTVEPPSEETTEPNAESATTQPTAANPPPPAAQSGATAPENGAPASVPAVPTTPESDATATPPSADSANSDQPSPVPFPSDQILNDQPPFVAQVTVDHADLTYREGDRVRIEFKAERDAHLYLLYHQADGQSRLLFPNPAQRDNRVAGGQSVVVPDSAQPLRFRIQPPFGIEVLQVLATLAPVPELDALVGGGAVSGHSSLSGGRQNLPLPSGEDRGEGGSNAASRLAPLPTAPRVSQQLLDQVRARLMKDKATWSEHRVLLRTEPKAGSPPPRKVIGGKT